MCSCERYLCRILNQIDLQGNGRRETGKIIVIREEPLDIDDFWLASGGPIESSESSAMPVLNMVRSVGNYLDARPTVSETDESNSTRLMNNSLRALLIRKAMRYGNMTISLGIDTRHLTAEELSMGGSVPKPVDGDIIMNHLMDDGILNEFFGQVNAGIDAKDEVLVAAALSRRSRAEQPCGKRRLAACEGEFAEEALGVREPDGHRRESTAEKTGVVLVKTGLYVRDRRNQTKFTILLFPPSPGWIFP